MIYVLFFETRAFPMKHEGLSQMHCKAEIIFVVFSCSRVLWQLHPKKRLFSFGFANTFYSTGPQLERWCQNAPIICCMSGVLSTPLFAWELSIGKRRLFTFQFTCAYQHAATWTLISCAIKSWDYFRRERRLFSPVTRNKAPVSKQTNYSETQNKLLWKAKQTLFTSKTTSVSSIYNKE